MTNTITEYETAVAAARAARAAARAEEQKLARAASYAEGFAGAAETIVHALEFYGIDRARARAAEYAEVNVLEPGHEEHARRQGWRAAGESALATFLA